MNDHTISLVKESFDLVTPIAPQAAALFKGDMVVQGHALMQRAVPARASAGRLPACCAPCSAVLVERCVQAPQRDREFS
jgi:hypothetical protein